MDEGRSSHEVWQEGHLTELFRILEPLCIKYVKATHLLPDLPFLRPYASKITKTERKSPAEATQMLFELMKNSDEADKWKKFTIALREADFQSLYMVCFVCEKNDFHFYIDIFDTLSTDFATNGVDIVDLSKGMLQSGSLTMKQFEHIKLVLKEEGEIAAILQFFSCQSSSVEIWLKALQYSLFAVNKKDLCKLIQKKGMEIDVFKKIDLEYLVKLYYDKICERVRPQDIKAYLRTYNLVPDMNLNTLSPSEEMSQILGNIEKSEDVGKWRSFLNALKHAGYESLHKIIANEGKDIDDSRQKNILKNVAPEIAKTLDIGFELLSQVKRDNLINERCYQEITKKKQDSGDIAAAEMLLENIHRFKDGWYQNFLRILMNVGQRNMVLNIDPDFYNLLERETVFEGEGKEVGDRIEKPFETEGNKVE